MDLLPNGEGQLAFRSSGASKPTVACITSTGVGLRERLTNTRELVISTDAGQVPIVMGDISGTRIVSLIRSSRPVAPHMVNYRANMLALREVGVRQVLATSIVGGLRANIRSGQLVLLDQFLDFTKHRACTVFGADEFRFVDFTNPYCPRLREAFLATAEEARVSLLLTGCYVGVDGPRYETAAEVRMFARLGGDVIGMSNIPECIFARELGICYASMAIVANPAAGLAAKAVRIEDINAATEERNPDVLQILRATIASLKGDATCRCVPETRTIRSTDWPPPLRPRAARP